jgi:hypothetical protein
MRLIIVLVLLLSLANSVLAAEGVLVAVTGQTKIPVWHSAQPQDDGQALLRSKADAALAMPLLSCIAEPETRAVIAGQDLGLYRRPVILLNGPAKGCRGIVAKENFAEREPEAPPKKSYPPPDCRKPSDQWTGERCIRAK